MYTYCELGISVTLMTDEPLRPLLHNLRSVRWADRHFPVCTNGGDREHTGVSPIGNLAANVCINIPSTLATRTITYVYKQTSGPPNIVGEYDAQAHIFHIILGPHEFRRC